MIKSISLRKQILHAQPEQKKRKKNALIAGFELPALGLKPVLLVQIKM